MQEENFLCNICSATKRHKGGGALQRGTSEKDTLCNAMRRVLAVLCSNIHSRRINGSSRVGIVRVPRLI